MLSADYIVGLTDGEGSFTAYLRPPVKRHGSKNYRVECHYYIKLRDDDYHLIEEVKNFFNAGRVSFQKDGRPNHHNCYRYETTNLKDITEVIIPFFDQHQLQGNKVYDYQLFKKIVKAVIGKEHQTSSGFARIQKIKKQMHIYRTRRIREIRSFGLDRESPGSALRGMGTGSRLKLSQSVTSRKPGRPEARRKTNQGQLGDRDEVVTRHP